VRLSCYERGEIRYSRTSVQPCKAHLLAAPLYPSTGQQIRQDVPLIAGVFIPTVPLLFPVCTKHAGAVVSKHYQLRWLVVYQVDI
jgi:hypothetical protein